MAPELPQPTLQTETPPRWQRPQPQPPRQLRSERPWGYRSHKLSKKKTSFSGLKMQVEHTNLLLYFWRLPTYSRILTLLALLAWVTSWWILVFLPKGQPSWDVLVSRGHGVDGNGLPRVAFPSAGGSQQIHRHLLQRVDRIWIWMITYIYIQYIYHCNIRSLARILA